MAAGRGGGGASPAGPTTPRWLVPASPLLMQGGEFCRSIMSLCLEAQIQARKGKNSLPAVARITHEECGEY